MCCSVMTHFVWVEHCHLERVYACMCDCITFCGNLPLPTTHQHVKCSGTMQVVLWALSPSKRANVCDSDSCLPQRFCMPITVQMSGILRKLKSVMNSRN